MRSPEPADYNMAIPTLLDSTWTVNEIVARYADTAAVFNRFGIDTCCGGGVSVAEAARREGVDLDAVLEALYRATSRSA
ncbi:MAG TPA: DUF542 domain-containing protein [Gemmatimonadaceae bacterium]